MSRDAGHVLVSDDNARVVVSGPEAGLDERVVRVVPNREDFFVHRRSVRTTYPDSLLSIIVSAKGIAPLCDEVARDQDLDYLERHLVATVTSHVDPVELAGRRLLDFGCGAGASTSILGRLLPDTEIVGIELEESFLEVARARAEFHGRPDIRFSASPSPESLPPDLGTFDVVMLSAVFEHLLPDERRRLMPMLWALVRPGGLLFIDETPWRWFPVETHTTKLPLLNYLPKPVVMRLAARQPKLRGRTSWPDLLRAGTRGGTVREITRSLGAADAELLRPQREGISDWVDLWFAGYASGASGRFAALKRSVRLVFKMIYRVTGLAPVPYLSLAYRKAA